MPSAPPDRFAALFEKTGGAAPPRGGPRVGETLWVVVVQVGKDAVFVELDGRRQGFIEAGSLRAPDGTLSASVGDKLRARVVRVDADSGIELVPTVETAVAAGASVSLAQPGRGAAAVAEAVKIALGQAVSGSVDRVESYGLFVQIDGTRGRSGRGLIPTVEIAEGRIRLSVCGLKDDEERAHFDGFREQEKKADSAQALGTLGDLLKKRSRR